MEKKATFFIDDVLWVFRDLTRERPKSMWDNPYLATLKKAHDEYGVKTQLNLFYKTSFWYGDDVFTLSEMTDAYKAEFEAASDWLRLGFHSLEEWPDYPFINADYGLVDRVFKLIYGEICRFAGEKSFARAVLPHWMPISKEGVRALCDNGIRIMYASYGERIEWDGNQMSLPYGHSFRLLHNRTPESGVYQKKTRDLAIATALCSYNHITDAQFESVFGKLATVKDSELNISYVPGSSIVLNLCPMEILESEVTKRLGNEYVVVANHEQYYYSDYYAYQPDYAEKILTMGKILHDAGYTFIFTEELPTNG